MTELFHRAGYWPCACTGLRLCPSCRAWLLVLDTFPDYKLPTLTWNTD